MSTYRRSLEELTVTMADMRALGMLDSETASELEDVIRKLAQEFS